MMTLDETMIINNMTNVIKNLEQSKRICDIIDDLNKLILTLGGRTYDEPEQVKTETKPEHLHSQAYASEQVKHVPELNKVVTVTPVQIKTEAKAEPVQKQTKDKTVTKKKTDSDAKAPAPGRGKVECRCGLMICSAAMSRHEKGTKHNEAMAKKEKTKMKQAEGQTLSVNDMDLVDIDTYMKEMLPYLCKKVRGLGGKLQNDETFGYMKIEDHKEK